VVTLVHIIAVWVVAWWGRSALNGAWAPPEPASNNLILMLSGVGVLFFTVSALRAAYFEGLKAAPPNWDVPAKIALLIIPGALFAAYWITPDQPLTVQLTTEEPIVVLDLPPVAPGDIGITASGALIDPSSASVSVEITRPLSTGNPPFQRYELQWGTGAPDTYTSGLLLPWDGSEVMTQSLGDSFSRAQAVNIRARASSTTGAPSPWVSIQFTTPS